MNNELLKQFKCNVRTCYQKQVEDICYQVFKNNTMHLIVKCKSHGWRYLPFMPGLDIPVRYSKAKKFPRIAGGTPQQAPRHTQTRSLFDLV